MYNQSSATNALNEFLEYKKHYKTRRSRAYLILRNRLVEEHNALVAGIARHFSTNGIFYDLIQEGKIGLIKALDYYTENKGQLSTYATYWIKKKIFRFMDRDDLIRKPIDIMAYCCKLIKNPDCSKDFDKIDEKKIRKSLHIKYRGDLDRIKSGLETFIVHSLDASLDDDGRTFSDLIGKEDITSDEMSLKSYEGYFSRLNENEQKVIRLRYTMQNKGGMSDAGKNMQYYTLEEIGKELNISKERVRQLEQRALRKLKILSMSKEDNKKPGSMVEK
jgi:RNA polymerase primary sigma factor